MTSEYLSKPIRQPWEYHMSERVKQYRITQRLAYIGDHQETRYDVHKGDDGRDYVFVDFDPPRVVGSFRDEKEALDFIRRDGGNPDEASRDYHNRNT